MCSGLNGESRPRPMGWRRVLPRRGGRPGWRRNSWLAQPRSFAGAAGRDKRPHARLSGPARWNDCLINEEADMTERRMPSRSGRGGWREWWVPFALILLCAIPMVAGAVRLVSLANGAEVTPENARFFTAPLPVVLHIVAAAAYIVLGAFQFVPGFRRRLPSWHRGVGRVVVGAGLVAALGSDGSVWAWGDLPGDLGGGAAGAAAAAAPARVPLPVAASAIA